jgi:hypothetical protein
VPWSEVDPQLNYKLQFQITNMHNATSTVLKVVAVGFSIFFLGFLVLSARMFWGQYRILKTWVAVDARVVSSRVVVVPTSSGEMLYDAEYIFAFNADGRPTIAVTNSNHQSTSRERKEKQVARFPPGIAATILYNPADPTELRMQPGYNVHFFAVAVFVIGLGAIMGLLALSFWSAARWLQRRETRTAVADAVVSK